MFHRYKTPKYYLSLSADDLAMVKGILLWWRNKLIREGVVSSIMRKIDYGSGRNLLQGAADRPLVTIQQAGRKGSRAAVRRLSCP